MTTVKEFISQTFDGKFVGDARNVFTSDPDGVILYTQRGTDIKGQPFETIHKGPGFLAEIAPKSDGSYTPRRRLEFRTHPVRESGSLEEILYGTASSHRTDVEALGLAIVVEATANGRGKVKTIWGDEARVALDSLGYPELADDLYIQNEKYR
jgi:hypothetical protein